MMMNIEIPKVCDVYEVNTDYHPFNLDNCLTPGTWPTARILDVDTDNVLIQWETGDRTGQDEWVAIVYFQAEIPMLIPALGIQ